MFIGKLEIRDGKQWKTLCDKNWTKADADRACKDLGFDAAIEALQPDDVDDDIGNISCTDFSCGEDEKFFRQCKKVRSQNCPRPCAVGVHCRVEGNVLKNLLNFPCSR